MSDITDLEIDVSNAISLEISRQMRGIDGVPTIERTINCDGLAKVALETIRKRIGAAMERSRAKRAQEVNDAIDAVTQ